ncbi:MAG: 1-deoxy-D-xylulose-5-phosphate reductoisomerase, partial [Desulfobaccales bacterium]
MKRLAILGSTGSIGRSTLAVVAEHPGEFAVTGLAAGQNVEILAQQIQEFQPVRVSVRDKDIAGRLARLLPANCHPAISWGPEGAKEIALTEGV